MLPINSTPTTVQPYREKFKLFAPHCLDSYKLGHRLQFTPGTQYIFSNFTARNIKHLGIPARYNDNKIVWFGFQGALRDFVATWDESFFLQPKEKALSRYRDRVAAFSSDDEVPSVEHLAQLHDLGYLPIRIKSIEEGNRVNAGIPLFTIVNTLPEFYWLTNSLETFLSNESWKSPTVATLAHLFKKILIDGAVQTGSPLDFVDWQGHCFADRGMSGMLDAAKTCAAHSTSFLGSDSVSSFDWLDYAYDAQNTFKGGSVNATEHSVMCLDGEGKEFDTVTRTISQVHSKGVVSFVADSWDFWRLLEWIVTQKDVIESRQFNSIGLSKVVVRPDSGDPVEILCGKELEDLTGKCSSLNDARYWMREVSVMREVNDTGHGECGESTVESKFIFDGRYYLIKIEIEWNRHDKQYYYVDGSSIISCEEVIPSIEEKGAVQFLYEGFGGTLTDKGFKVLWNRIGLIYGDSITPATAIEIIRRLAKKGFASCNVVLGVGLAYGPTIQ